MTPSLSPQVSFVVVSRNDDHGGDLTGRMQTFLNALGAQCDQHRLAAQLIVVEWNPPQSRRSLLEELNWPVSRHLDTRIFTVPPHVHSEIASGRPLPIFQMIAKNVGIRRSSAPWVIATNIDIIFSDGLMSFLSNYRFRHNSFYRTDRWDVPSRVQQEVSVEKQLNLCETHPLRRYSRLASFDFETNQEVAIYPAPRFFQRRYVGGIYRRYFPRPLKSALRRYGHLFERG